MVLRIADNGLMKCKPEHVFLWYCCLIGCLLVRFFGLFQFRMHGFWILFLLFSWLHLVGLEDQIKFYLMIKDYPLEIILYKGGV